MKTTPKIKQSETVLIMRSQIKFAAYNPRKEDKKIIEQLKRNFKKVGFLGGVQWNDTTGNLIGGHKRVQTLDAIHGYDGTDSTDYEVKVEKISLDEKTEMEQNIFLNNKRAQGETDFFKLADMLPIIDTDAAGLVDFDIKMVESIVPNFTFGQNETIQQDIKSIQPQKSAEEKKKHVKSVKESFKNDTGEKNRPTHFIVTFRTYDEKAAYLESIGVNGDTVFLTSETYFEKTEEK